MCYSTVELPVMTKIPDLETRNATSITIRWREWRNPPDRGSGPVSDYIVYYKARNETDWFALNRSNFRSASVANLQPMQSYQFRVAAVHLMGFVGPPSSALTIITCGRKLQYSLVLQVFVWLLETIKNFDILWSLYFNCYWAFINHHSVIQICSWSKSFLSLTNIMNFPEYGSERLRGLSRNSCLRRFQLEGPTETDF